MDLIFFFNENYETLIVLFVLFITIILLTQKVAAELIGIIGVIIFITTGVLTPEKALSGFGSTSLVTLFGLNIVSQSLLKNVIWVFKKISERIETPRKLIAFIAFFIVPISAIIPNNVLIESLFPLVNKWCQEKNISFFKIATPLAIFVWLGNTLTILNSLNLLISQISNQLGYGSLNLFSTTPISLPILLLTSFYFLISNTTPPYEESIVLPNEQQILSELPDESKKNIISIAITICMYILPSITNIPLVVLALVICKCVKPSEVIIFNKFLLLGFLASFSLAMQITGLSDLIASNLEFVLNEIPFYFALVIIFLVTLITSNLIGRYASVAFILPIAIEFSTGFGISPNALIMLVLFGANFSVFDPGYNIRINPKYLVDVFKYGVRFSFIMTLTVPAMVIFNYA